MAESSQPKILQIIADMRMAGASDEVIIDNLRQIGLSDDQIKAIMRVADQDVYSKFKREMLTFVREQIGQSGEVINAMVKGSLDQQLGSIKKEVAQSAESTVGTFAKTVNEKMSDLSLALKKSREEELRLEEETKLMRVDIDILLRGPSKLRLALSITFLAAGLITMLYTMIMVTPGLLAWNFSDIAAGIASMFTGAMHMIVAIVFVVTGVYFSGKPGGQ